MTQSVLQPWLADLSMMQQTVVIELARGPDGLTKYHVSKYVLRWFRRCFLYSAMDRRILKTPYEEGGGSFTGPSYKIEWSSGLPQRIICGSNLVLADASIDAHHWELPMHNLVSEYIRGADELPHHWYRHFMHGVEILGYKHPDDRIRHFWNLTYIRFCRDLHLNPEVEEQMDKRLGDNRGDWIAAGDLATIA